MTKISPELKFKFEKNFTKISPKLKGIFNGPSRTEIFFKFKFKFRWNFCHIFPNFWPIIYPRYTIDCMNRTKSEELFYLKKSIFWSSVFNFQNCFKNISDVLRYAKYGMYGLRMTWIFWILNKKIFGKKIWFYAPHLMLAVKNHKQVFPIFGLFLGV